MTIEECLAGCEEFDRLLILRALDEFYTEHSGLATYEAINEGRVLDNDLLWCHFEEFTDDPFTMAGLVEDKIAALKDFLKAVKNL